MDNKIWFSNINLLVEKDTLFNIIPTSVMSNGEKINSITRFSLYLSLLLYLATGNYLYLYIILGTIIVTYLIYIFNEKEFFKNDTNDNSNDNSNDNTNDSNDNTNDTNELCKKPTMENPLMNPLLGDNPYENKGSCNVENNKILEKIDKRFCNRLFQNTSSIFNNRNNQRAFYTVPSSGSVNDQTAFAKWLYNTPVSCEIGNHGILKQTRGCALNNKSLNEIKNEL
jgi:hypothetical protein